MLRRAGVRRAHVPGRAARVRHGRAVLPARAGRTFGNPRELRAELRRVRLQRVRYYDSVWRILDARLAQSDVVTSLRDSGYRVFEHTSFHI